MGWGLQHPLNKEKNLLGYFETNINSYYSFHFHHFDTIKILTVFPLNLGIFSYTVGNIQLLLAILNAFEIL